MTEDGIHRDQRCGGARQGARRETRDARWTEGPTDGGGCRDCIVVSDINFFWFLVFGLLGVVGFSFLFFSFLFFSFLFFSCSRD